jgi:PAS domain S-box-containing protein
MTTESPGTAVLDLLSTGVAIVSPDETLVFVNRAWCMLFGVRPSDCLGKLVGDVFPQFTETAGGQAPRDTLRDGVPRSAHIPFRQGLLELRATRSAQGDLVLEVRDWTRLARLERQYDRLLESITDGLCVLDHQWHFLYWNAAAEEITGVSRAELLGKPVRHAFRNLAETPVGIALRESILSRSERRVQRWQYEGDEHGRAAGIYDAYSYPVEGGGLLVIFREVSEQITQERELADRSAEADALRRLARAVAEENDFDALLRLLSEDAMNQCSADGSAVVQVNADDAEIVAAYGNSSVLRGSRFPLAGSLTERAIRLRAIISEQDYAKGYPALQALTKSVTTGPILITPLIAHNHVLGVLSVSRRAGRPNFTTRDRERLQAIADHASLGLWKLRLLDDAQAASQAKSDFMATMSHELRTPLTALTGYGELLAEQIVGPLTDQQADVVERMRSVTHHLAVVIDEILTFSNLEAGRESVRLRPVDLSVLVNSVMAVVEPMARDKGIALPVDVPTGLHLVTDPDKVRQILVNLVGNAIKFTDAGHVRLDVSANGEGATFRIEDTGIGIRAMDRPRLFQPFTQLESGLTRRHGGTGLGLFISRRLATLLGGEVTVESEVNKGSVFTLTLPPGAE